MAIDINRWQLSMELSSRSTRLKDRNSRSCLEARDLETEILDLVSKHETERQKFSISSRSTRPKDRNSRSPLEAQDRRTEILDLVSKHETERKKFLISSRGLKNASRYGLPNNQTGHTKTKRTKQKRKENHLRNVHPICVTIYTQECGRIWKQYWLERTKLEEVRVKWSMVSKKYGVIYKEKYGKKYRPKL